MTSDDLYVNYKTWATGVHERPMSKKAFGTELAERGFPAVKQGGMRGRQGLCLRS